MTNERFGKLWQRNVIAVPFLVAGLLIWAGIEVWPAWTRYRHTIDPVQTIDRGQAAVVDGETWRIQSVRRLDEKSDRDSIPVTEGAALITVVIARTGAGRAGVTCSGVLTDGTRQWLTDPVSSLPLDAGSTDICAMPGRLQFTFEIPDDVVPSAVDIKAYDGQILVRMLL